MPETVFADPKFLNRLNLPLGIANGQLEAPSLGKPVVVLRDKTERPEAVETGTARLVGTDPHAIVTEVTRLLDDETEYARRARVTNVYGDGRASQRIAAAILDYFS